MGLTSDLESLLNEIEVSVLASADRLKDAHQIGNKEVKRAQAKNDFWKECEKIIKKAKKDIENVWGKTESSLDKSCDNQEKIYNLDEE